MYFRSVPKHIKKELCMGKDERFEKVFCDVTDIHPQGYGKKSIQKMEGHMVFYSPDIIDVAQKSSRQKIGICGLYLSQIGSPKS